ncbi:hypothetical protein MNBD_UNCLBAC01-925 [hydrothermal vent metagenome]|uniref:Histidine kinase domain-containing protein n=1 Tax=hydrothermal vent metagenome TaxID=652676 RepID=A0A3B1E4D6_9ZZZZ
MLYKINLLLGLLVGMSSLTFFAFIQLYRQKIQMKKIQFATETMVSEIVHEIRNPLTALQTFHEYLPEKIDDKQFLSNYSNLIGRELERMEDFLDHLLDFARPQPINFMSIDFHNLLESPLLLLEHDFKRNNIEIIQDVQENFSVNIYVDSNQMQQILMNLFFNAIDGMTNGGRLTITTSVEMVKSWWQKDLFFVIAIADTGCGIKDKHLLQIFNPFFTQKAKGTGLGLSITKGLIEGNGGTIDVQSTENVGTIFTMKFPVIKKT